MEVDFINIFIEENDALIKKLYYEHRNAFFGFGKKYSLTDTELADIYQDAFLALRKQAISGKLYEVKSSLKTYLFGIGKHLIYNELKRQNNFTRININDNNEVARSHEIVLNTNTDLTLEQKLLQKYFKKLGEKCKNVLTLFYYRGLTNEEIAQKENYENEAVVRSQKSRCLKTLKEYIKSSL